MQNTFNQKILKHISPETTIVLAFSGGVDSRVLLHLLSQMAKSHPIKTKAVHIHHGLSRNADIWQKNCQTWCEQADVPFFSEKVVLDIGTGRSLEELAREARYNVLGQHIGNNDVLLTGQHMSDQTETFLLALKRGSGPKGLSGMPTIASFGEGEILRPLLDVSRHDIEQYALNHKLNWNHDESNDDTQFDRNFLRHQVVPELSRRWPGFEKSVQRSAQLCAEQQHLLEELLSQSLSDALFNDGSLSISMLEEHSELARAQLIRMWLASSGSKMPSRKQLQVIWQDVACSQQDANPSFSLPSGEIRRYDNRLYLAPSEHDLSDWREELSVGKTLHLPYDLGELTLNIGGQNTSLGKTASGSPLLLRQPLPSEKVMVHFCPQGLSAKPAGRKGSRKLKKLFQEYGVPSWKRRQMPIVMYDDKVAAIANLFVTQEYKALDCELVWSR
nr:tRNA lysidine(34) synthetase TilS [Vibrio sp. S9_S30]